MIFTGAEFIQSYQKSNVCGFIYLHFKIYKFLQIWKLRTKESGKENLCVMFHIQVCKVNFMKKKSFVFNGENIQYYL
jgi:hypothetical protein